MFNKEQLQPILNVIDFIKGNTENISKTDIDNALNSMKTHPGQEDILQLTIQIENLLYKRSKEVHNFCNILANNNIEYSERDAHTFKNLPFKTSKNIELECYLISQLFGLKENRYDALIYSFISIMPAPKEDIKKWESYFNIFMEYENINFSSFTDNPKINPQNIYPSDKEIEENFEKAKHLYARGYNNLTEEEKTFYSASVGMYFEKVACQQEWEYLCAAGRPDLAQRIFWVSRYVGDGFGYDVLSFDPETETPKLIEVKGTLSPNLIYEVTLSYNEFKKIQNENLNSFIYRYYLSEDKIGRYILTSQTNNELKIIDENNAEFNYDKEAAKSKQKVKIKK